MKKHLIVEEYVRRIINIEEALEETEEELKEQISENAELELEIKALEKDIQHLTIKEEELTRTVKEITASLTDIGSLGQDKIQKLLYLFVKNISTFIDVSKNRVDMVKLIRGFCNVGLSDAVKLLNSATGYKKEPVTETIEGTKK